jgi:hypothetical protein
LYFRHYEKKIKKGNLCMLPKANCRPEMVRAEKAAAGKGECQWEQFSCDSVLAAKAYSAGPSTKPVAAAIFLAFSCRFS